LTKPKVWCGREDEGRREVKQQGGNVEKESGKRREKEKRKKEESLEMPYNVEHSCRVVNPTKRKTVKIIIGNT